MTKNASATIRLVSLLACALALCVAVVVWLANPDQGHAVATPPGAAGSKAAVAPDDLVPPAPRENAPAPSRTKATSTSKPDPEPAPTASSRATYPVRFSLERPDRAPIVVPQADIEVVLSDGTQLHAKAASGARTSMRLPGGMCTVRVHADGFVHHDQAVLVQSDRRERGHADDDPQDERLVLLAVGEEWVAVVVKTNDDRPFRALAEDLGLEPKRFFYLAFDMRVQLSPPVQGVPFAAGAEHVATFHRPPEYKSFEFASGVAGQLEFEHAPPMWAQLFLFGAPLGVEVIHPGDLEVVFHLDQTAFDAACARVKLRVLDAKTHAPITDAKVTLRADTAPHRRTDQEDVRPEWDGSVEFPRVMPGKYELTVTHGDDLDQRRIELVAKQVLDVGDVLLEQRGHIDVLVVDEAGQAISAYIEIAPFEPGKRVDRLYPPMLHWSSDTHGKFRLPLPAKTSIVRARVEVGTSGGQPAQGPRTANLLLDPDKLPPQPWRIVLREPVSTSFQVGLRDVVTVEVRDELGIVDTWPKLDKQGKATCDLVPGRHKARYLDGANRVRNEQDFVVAKDSSSVRGP